MTDVTPLPLPDPWAAAIAIAGAAQVDDDLAKRLVNEYAREGVDMRRVAYVACNLLGKAEVALTANTGNEPGSLLSSWGQRAALRALERPSPPS